MKSRDQGGITRAVFVAMAMVAAVLAGCASSSVQSSASPSSVPTSVMTASPITASVPPTVAPSASAASSAAPGITGKPACLDAAAYAIVQGVVTATDDGAAIAALTTNRDALIIALEGFEPPAAFDARWRDELVAALKANDYETAVQKILLIQTGQVVLTSC